MPVQQFLSRILYKYILLVCAYIYFLLLYTTLTYIRRKARRTPHVWGYPHNNNNNSYNYIDVYTNYIHIHMAYGPFKTVDIGATYD